MPPPPGVLRRTQMRVGPEGAPVLESAHEAAARGAHAAAADEEPHPDAATARTLVRLVREENHPERCRRPRRRRSAAAGADAGGRPRARDEAARGARSSRARRASAGCAATATPRCRATRCRRTCATRRSPLRRAVHVPPRLDRPAPRQRGRRRASTAAAPQAVPLECRRHRRRRRRAAAGEDGGRRRRAARTRTRRPATRRASLDGDDERRRRGPRARPASFEPLSQSAVSRSRAASRSAGTLRSRTSAASSRAARARSRRVGSLVAEGNSRKLVDIARAIRARARATRGSALLLAVGARCCLPARRRASSVGWEWDHLPAPMPPLAERAACQSIEKPVISMLMTSVR